MRLHHLLAATALAGMLLAAENASAFTVDEKSGTNPDGSARYVDPDEQTLPFQLFSAQTQNNDIDRSSGSRYAAPAADGNYQWLNFFDLFSTPSPRK
jgi:spore coat protein U-like protein